MKKCRSCHVAWLYEKLSVYFEKVFMRHDFFTHLFSVAVCRVYRVVWYVSLFHKYYFGNNIKTGNRSACLFKKYMFNLKAISSPFLAYFLMR